MRCLHGILFWLTFSAAACFAGNNYDQFVFGVDYYPEHWPREYWEKDAELMRQCGVNTVRMAEFAWYYMEPEEGVYRFDLFDEAIEVLARHGIKTILGTPTAAPPKWLTNKYPEVLNLRPDGRPYNDQGRRHTTYNSPVYRKLCRAIVNAMATHYRNNPNVIGWQTDNEFNCHVAEFYSESDRRAFRQWLQQKYGSLEALNERWGTGFWSQWYTAWDQIDLPFPAAAEHNPALILDYKRFISHSVIQFQHDQVEIIRRNRPRDFITHNGIFPNIDYYEFCKDLDILAYDNYPAGRISPQYSAGVRFTLVRGFMDHFMIMEQQAGPGGQTWLAESPRPGQMSLWAFQAIAHGAEGMVHFRWRTARKGIEQYWYGVLDQDNIPRERFFEFRKEGCQINRIAGEIKGSRIVSEIAVVKKFDDQWALEHQHLTTEVDLDDEHMDIFRAASELKYNIDIISEKADFKPYRVIFAPHQIMVDSALAGKIREYVNSGGIYIISAQSAIKGLDNEFTDRPLPVFLDDLFGVRVKGFQCYKPPSGERNSVLFRDGAKAPVHVWADDTEVTGADTVATWTDDYLKGHPACTERRSKAGKAVYYGSFFNHVAARYLISRYAKEAGLAPILSGLPDELEVTRRSAEKCDYIFVLNHAERAMEITLPAGLYDLLEDRPMPERYSLQPYEYKVLRSVKR